MASTRPVRASWWMAAAVMALLCSACSSSDMDTTERNSEGAVVEGGEVGVNNLQVGDCITKAALEGTPTEESAPAAEIESLPAVPCDEPHGGEVVLVNATFFQDVTGEPTTDELFDKSTDPCVTAIADYTGFDLNEYVTAQEEPDVETIFAPFTLVPTAQTWAAGDRSLTCVAVSVEDDLATIVERSGSAKQG